jgi:hypothetical protein
MYGIKTEVDIIQKLPRCVNNNNNNITISKSVSLHFVEQFGKCYITVGQEDQEGH